MRTCFTLAAKPYRPVTGPRPVDALRPMQSSQLECICSSPTAPVMPQAGRSSNMRDGVAWFTIFCASLSALAWRVFGWQYAMDTVIGTVVFSVCVDWLNFLSTYHVVGDIMLNAIFGGVLAGVGFGFIFRARANSGGLDVVGAVVKKYYSFDMGTAIFVLNIGIIFLGVRLFDVETALFTLVSIYLTAALTNRVVAGFNREKQILIVSPRAEEIAARIMARTGRGVTVFDGRGAFTGEHKDILFVIASLTQVSTVKFIVDAFDPTAFMIVSDTSEVMGRGFTLENHLQAEEKHRLKELQQEDARR